MSVNTLIQATALNRFYGEYHAVKDFNLTLNKGEVLGLLGPNGAGKSTTMQMLTGNISPSSGEVIINGVNLLDEPQQAKRQIGYLPEQPPIYRDMTVLEFLNYCASLHDIAKNNIKAAVADAIERCSLQTVVNKLIASLSKGYQQRVGIAQAILHRPEVVILDEPTVGLDPIQITKIRDLIRELGKDHSVILSTHILPEVQAVCDRVQIINQGETVFSDSFSELAQKQASNLLVVGFEHVINEADLRKATGIKQIKALTNNRFQLEFDEKSDASSIYKLAIEQGWVLTELSPQDETLEQIFMNLVYTDTVTKNIDKNLDKNLDKGIISQSTRERAS
ncbi:MAG: ATP-binding cassette domain-containing protein [Cocleimonas sp.]